MREHIGSVNFKAYIENLVPVGLDGSNIILQSTPEIQASYIDEKLAEQIKDSIVKADVGITDFMLVVEGADGSIRPVKKNAGGADWPNPDPNFTFDSYVVGESNGFVNVAATNSAEDPGLNYNPGQSSYVQTANTSKKEIRDMGAPLNEKWRYAKLCDSVGKLCYDDEFGYFYLVGLSVNVFYEGDNVYLKNGDKYMPNGTGNYISYPIMSSDVVNNIFSAFSDVYIGNGRQIRPGEVSNMGYTNTFLDVTGKADIHEFVIELRIQDCKLKLKQGNGTESYSVYDSRITQEYSSKVRGGKPVGSDFFMLRTMRQNPRRYPYGGNIPAVELQDTAVSSSESKYVSQSKISGDKKEDLVTFLNREIAICGTTEDEWVKIASPLLSECSVGDAVYLSGADAGEITLIYDQPNENFMRIRLLSGEEKDIGRNVSVWYLPTRAKTVRDEFDEINRAYREQLLSPYVVAAGGTYNVFWYSVPDAASYHVVVYRTIERKNMPCVIKMKDFEVDRNTGFFAIDKLVGTGFIFKVYAENRDGETISESRGILDSGEPVTLMRKR